MAQRRSPKRRRSPQKMPLTLKTPQEFEIRQPASIYHTASSSQQNTSSFMSLSHSSSPPLIDQSDQFFIVPGMEGALSREEFSKLSPTGSPEKGRFSETSFTEMAAARQSLCDIAEVARRKEQEWRTLQELRIRGLEDAVQGREQSLQQERRRFQRTVDEMTQKEHSLERKLAESGAAQKQAKQLQESLDVAESNIRQLTQERDSLNAKLTNIIAKQEDVETAAIKLREENEELMHKCRSLEKEASTGKRSTEWLTKRLEHAESEREKLSASELQLKVTVGKMQGYLNNEENTLQVCRAELNNVKDAKETVELELAAEKTHIRELKAQLLKLENERAVSLTELEEKLADKTKKITFLVHGIKTLETDWKERYRELQETSTSAVDEMQRSHAAEQEKLLAIIRAGEDKLRQSTQHTATAQAEAERLRSEQEVRIAEEAEARRVRAEERREAAQLLAARDLSLAELRAKLERQSLESAAAAGDRKAINSLNEKLDETKGLLKQWQTACTKLRAYAERVTADRDRLLKRSEAQPLPSSASLQIEKDNARLKAVVRRMREELEVGRHHNRHGKDGGSSTHCSCSSTDDVKAVQIQQLLVTNAKLNETIETQSATMREIQAELNRHRAAAQSSQFLRQETAYLRSLMETGDGMTAADGSVVSADGSESSLVRELRYKLQLAARYIAHLGKEKSELLQRQKELEDRLSAAQRNISLPEHLDKLRLSQQSFSPAITHRSEQQITTAASFAELLDQLNKMQVDTDLSARATRSDSCGTLTRCRHGHILNSCRHSPAKDFEPVNNNERNPRVPRLVGLGDCLTPDGTRSVSTDELTSGNTAGTGDMFSAKEVVQYGAVKKRYPPRSRSASALLIRRTKRKQSVARK